MIRNDGPGTTATTANISHKIRLGLWWLLYLKHSAWVMCFVGNFTRSAVRWPQKQHGPLVSLWSFIFLSQTQHRSAVKVTVNSDCSFLAFPPSSHPTGQRIKSMSATCLSFTISFCFSVKPHTVPSIVQCEHHTGLHHSPLPEYKSHNNGCVE